MNEQNNMNYDINEGFVNRKELKNLNVNNVNMNK